MLKNSLREAWVYSQLFLWGTLALFGVGLFVDGSYLAGVPLAIGGWIGLVWRLLKGFVRHTAEQFTESQRVLGTTTSITVQLNLERIFGHSCLRRVHEHFVSHLPFEQWRDALVAAVPGRVGIERKGSVRQVVRVNWIVSGHQVWIDDAPTPMRYLFRKWELPGGWVTAARVDAVVGLRVAVIAGRLVLQVGGHHCFTRETAIKTDGTQRREWETIASVPLLYMESQHSLPPALLLLGQRIPGLDVDRDERASTEDVHRYLYWQATTYMDGDTRRTASLWEKNVAEWKSREGVGGDGDPYYNKYWTVSLNRIRREDIDLSDWSSYTW